METSYIKYPQADKARGFLSEGDSEISALIAKHVGSYQIGSVFPDFLYQCGTNHDNGRTSIAVNDVVTFESYLKS